MFRNYLKTASRHLLHHKYYVLINVVGLGLGITLSILAYLNWKFDADFDKFHSKADKLFRIETVKSSNQDIYGVAPAPLAAIAKNNIAGVKDAIIVDNWGAAVNYEDRTFYQNILFTEANFTKWFNFPLLKGTVNLDDPGAIVMTESMAKKYFGDEDPIGKALTVFPELTRQRDLLVSGIVQDPPKNSSITFDFIANINNQMYANGDKLLSTDWKKWRDAIFLAVDNPSDAPYILTQLDQHVAAHQSARPDFETKQFFLEPFVGMIDNARAVRRNSLMSGTPDSAIWGNMVMAILLLLTACLNFSNMTISMSGKRIKEIGVRKVMGGTQQQLIGQLLLESLLICLLGLVFGLALTDFATEWYNQMWKYIDLQLVLADNPPIIIFLISTVILTTIMAGAYPAFYISSFNPNRIFHGSVKFGGTNLVSKVLLGFQVAISLIAVIAGLSFYQNADFQQNTDLGFNRTSTQAIYTGDETTFTVMQNEINKSPNVIQSAGVRHHIGDSCPRHEFTLNGEPQGEAEYMEVGTDYLSLMDIETVKGRTFKEDMETDYQNAIMINEKFARDFFPNIDPIGQEVTFFDTLNCRIVGVVGDFMQDSFFDPLRPLVLKYSKADRFLYLAVRSDPKDLKPVEMALASAWKTNFPTKPFVHNFQNEFLANAMEVTANIKSTMSVFAIITMVLTITGLFALMSLSILKRMKEIAVRRVLGATVGNISYILNRNYFWVIIAGIVVGSGFGAWLSFMLLDSIYDIHAGISSIMLTAAGVISLLVVFITIGIKVWQVMRMNPAEVLKGD